MRILSWLSVLGVLVSGCGYTLAGRGSTLPASIKTIGIPLFANRTTVFNLETTLTMKVRSEFIGRGKYDIQPEAANVDAVLTGEITAVSITPASINANQLASRYAITMVARVELKDVKTDMVLWENPSLVFRQEYDATGTTSGAAAVDPAAYFGQNTDALERLSTEFARSIVSAILEAF
jgi:hypothetical protein